MPTKQYVVSDCGVLDPGLLGNIGHSSLRDRGRWDIQSVVQENKLYVCDQCHYIILGTTYVIQTRG